MNFKTPKEMVAEWEKTQELNARPQIILNRIKTPDGTIITSYFRHDYVTHLDANGKEYMVDGGLDYLRRNCVEDSPYEELSVTDDAPFEQIRESLHWGSRGKKGDQQLKFIPICEMADEHLKAIIKLNMGAEFIRLYMKDELNYRKKNNIKIED